MDFPVTTRIDTDKCTGCGLCVEVCPSDTLSMRADESSGKMVAVITGEYSLQCDHCAAVCPEEAITLSNIEPRSLKLDTMPMPETYADTTLEPAEFIHLIHQRRSCREYRKKPLSRDVLSDLVKIGTMAPSGTNCQLWTFTLLNSHDSVTRLGEAIGHFFRLFNKIAKFPPVRLLSKVLPRDPIGLYNREFHERVARALREYDEHGRDRLFYGAPSVILVGSKPGGSTPKEDALLAAQNILLAAHAMGLGTCLIGLAVEAIRIDPRIRRLLELGPSEQIHAVITVGYPKVHYHRPAGRRHVTPRWFE